MFFTKSINVYIGFPSLYCLSYLFFIIPSDATTYAHFLFNAFDLDRNGSIRFEVRISLLIVFLYTLNLYFFIVQSLPWLYCSHWQDFVIGLSVLLRGSVTEKLNWAFNLYDINKDGYITKEVLTKPSCCKAPEVPSLILLSSGLKE